MAAFVAVCARRFELGIAHCRKALSLNPGISVVHSHLGDCLYLQGKTGEARDEYLAEPIEMYRQTRLAIAEHRLGNVAAGEQALSRLVAALGDGATYQQAQIFAQWGRLDDAIAKLLFARQVGDVGILLVKTDPFMDPVRNRPEFRHLLSELGLS